MASSILVSNNATIKYVIGVNSKGEDVVNSQNFKNVNVALTDDKLVAFSDEVEKLLDYSISTIQKECQFVVTR